MAIELTDSHCDQIRKAIDVGLDAVLLPNEIILLDIYAAYAVSKVKARLPADLDSSYDASAIIAAIFTCAALLVPAVKQVSTDRRQGSETVYKLLDWDKKQIELDNRADQVIESIINKLD